MYQTTTARVRSTGHSLVCSKQRGAEKEEDGTIVKIQSFTRKTHLLDILLNTINMNSFSASFCLQYKVLRCVHNPAFNEDRARSPIPSNRITVWSIAWFSFLQTAITFDSFGITGATTYQNEALSMFYISNGWNFHGSISYS